jgi:formate hydrogenlyase subunit 4
LFAEPTLFIGFVVLARQAHSLSLSTMAGYAAISFNYTLIVPLLLVAVSFFIVTLAENCRIPVDDPATHLELTMIHEVMVLDHSGPDFAFILYGAALKLFLMVSLVAHLLFPLTIGDPLKEWAIYLAAVFFVAIVIGIVESIMARLRMVKVPRLLMIAGIIALLGMILSWNK